MDPNEHPLSTQAEVNRPGTFTPALHKLAAIGVKTKAVVEEFFTISSGVDLAFRSLPKWEERDVVELADALDTPWTDDDAAVMLNELHRLGGEGVELVAQTVAGWVKAHPNEPEMVVDCATVIPPEGITILKALSKTGSQKRVYVARWKQAHREVIVKRLLGTLAQQQVVFERELQSHPLAMKHPNIIATHPLLNYKGDRFLIEEKIPEPLNDSWRASGIHEAANLLYDIAQALAYLHGELRLVHGDVKPDNIGRRGVACILLDFGICRRDCEFSREASATGSLRTRAPELFLTDSYPIPEPGKVDVWALGATVFKAMTGRFPFVDEGETVPRVSTPLERAAFEKEIARRISHEWNARVNLNEVADPLRTVLSRVLTREPDRRVSAKELVTLCVQKLAGFLSEAGGGSVTPEAELDQILRHLPRDRSLSLMPIAARQQLAERLRQLKEAFRLLRDRDVEIDGSVPLMLPTGWGWSMLTVRY